MTERSIDNVERGDQLIARIETEMESDDISTADTMQLLSCLFAGYPVERLAPLLRSDNPLAVKSGAFLAAEMTDRAAPLLSDIERLLLSPMPWVRHDAIEVVLSAATASHGRVVAQAIRLIDDQHPAIREDAMHLLAHAADGQLRSSIVHLDPVPARLTAWLLDTAPDRLGDELPRLLRDPDPLTRRFAAAALVRHADSNTELPTAVSTGSDTDIAAFVARELGTRRR